MLWLTVVICCLGLVTCQRDPVTERIIEFRFRRLDASPCDGHVTEAEFIAQSQSWDLNDDGCVTMAEFKATHQRLPDARATMMFHRLDVDSNNCLSTSDLQAMFHRIDANGDDQLTLSEFKKFMTNVFNTFIQPPL